MEAFLLIGLFTCVILFFVQRGTLQEQREKIRDLDDKLSSWTTWGYGIQRNSEALRKDADALSARIHVLEQELEELRRYGVAAPTAAQTPPAAAAAPDIAIARSKTSIAASPVAQTAHAAAAVAPQIAGAHRSSASERPVEESKMPIAATAHTAMASAELSRGTTAVLPAMADAAPVAPQHFEPRASSEGFDARPPATVDMEAVRIELATAADPDHAAYGGTAPTAAGPAPDAQGAATATGRVQAAFDGSRAEPAGSREAAPTEGTPAAGVGQPFGPRRGGLDWESLIGVRLFSWIAGISLLLGAVFFLRYSAENGWLSPPIRMAMGFATGLLLLAGCEWKGRNYRVTANALDAAGIGTLFATSFAAHAVWDLVPATVALLLLVLVTTAATLLSIRRNSLFIALLGLVGGFSTPILLSTGENNPFGLFGYLLLLNLGLAIVGYRKRWPLLTALSIGFTTLYQWGWLVRFAVGDAGQLPIAIGIFLLFPATWLAANRVLGTKDADSAPSWIATILAIASALPLCLALVMAWVPAFGERYLLLFAYLFVLDLGLLAHEYFRPVNRLGLVAAAATVLVWLSWVMGNYTSDSWPTVNLLLGGFVALFLGAQLLYQKRGKALPMARFAAPVLLLLLPIFVAVEPLAASPAIPCACLLLLLSAIAATAILCRDGRLYFVAVPSVVLTQGVWSARYLDESRLIQALLIYLAFALAFILIPMLARRLARPFEPAEFGAIVPLLSLLLLFFLAVGTAGHRSLWVIGLLLIVLNIGLFIEARASRLTTVAFIGLGLSWLIFGLWWQKAIDPGQLVLALVVVLVLVLLTVGGLLFLRSGSTETAGKSRNENGPLLGLVGYLFLLFVAAQPTLASPPWPLFAITLLLNLALVAASLYLQRSLLAMAGLNLSQLVLGVWAAAQPAHVAPFLAAEVAMVAALLVVGLAEAVVILAKARGLDGARFRLGCDITLLVTLGLAIVLSLLGDPPRLWATSLTEVVVLGLLMLASRGSDKHGWILGGWIGTALLAIAWIGAHYAATRWPELLVLVAIPYAMLTFYPAFCAARSKPKRWPFLIATASSLSFFGGGYVALNDSPLHAFMGVLPLGESLVMSGLLLYLLRVVEPAAPRDVGRLAFVAAVALGYATTAIPLQLENEWLTVAWALEACVVAWLYFRLRHPGLLGASLILAGAVTIRLVFNPAVFLYHERGSIPVLNFYLYTYAVSAAALFGASWWLRDAVEPRFPWLQKTAWLERAFAAVLLFVLLNIEIADFYSEGKEVVFRFSSTLAQDLTYTLGWAMFAIGMLVAGILSKGRAARIAALVLLTATIAKCFLHDLWRLGGLYRVGSFVGLALCLTLVAVILQRFVLAPSPGEDRS